MVDLYVDSYNQIIVYRLDNGSAGMLKGDSLGRARGTIDLYNYNYNSPKYGVYSEIQVEERDIMPIDTPYVK
jgi:hypothetical protein